MKDSSNPSPAGSPAASPIEAPAALPAKAQARRQQVLQAATACFRRSGFHSASMAAIAAEAGMSVGHIYHYFENKEAIIQAIVQQDLEKFLAFSERVRGRSNVREAMIDEIDSGLSKALDPEATSMRLEVLAEVARNPRLSALMRAVDDTRRAGLQEMLERAHPPKDEAAQRQLAARGELMAALFEGMSIRGLRHPEMERELVIEGMRKLMRFIIESETL